MSVYPDLLSVLWPPVLPLTSAFYRYYRGGRDKCDGRGRYTQENAEAFLRVLLDLENHCDFVLIELDTLRGNYSGFLHCHNQAKTKNTCLELILFKKRSSNEIILLACFAHCLVLIDYSHSI